MQAQIHHHSTRHPEQITLSPSVTTRRESAPVRPFVVTRRHFVIVDETITLNIHISHLESNPGAPKTRTVHVFSRRSTIIHKVREAAEHKRAAAEAERQRKLRLKQQQEAELPRQVELAAEQTTIRGGKYVIQVKQYKDTVQPSAVRDSSSHRTAPTVRHPAPRSTPPPRWHEWPVS
jgi:hypothetical protein